MSPNLPGSDAAPQPRQRAAVAPRSAAPDHKYVAFLSYRTGEPIDRAFAERLHAALEAYRVPRRLVRRGFPSRLGLVFLDRRDMAAAPSLEGELRKALADSKFLIVICSRRTPASQWIELEVQEFLQRDRRGQILLLLIDGDDTSSFPPPLLVAPVPRAADARPRAPRGVRSQLADTLPQLIAPMLGCEVRLLQRVALQRRLLRAGAAALGIVLVAALGAAAFPQSRERVSGSFARWMNSDLELGSSEAPLRFQPRGAERVVGVAAHASDAREFPWFRAIVVPEMVELPGGTFVMGDAHGAAEESPHEVELATFLIGRTEVTVEQFNAFRRARGLARIDEPANRAVTNVSWDECAGYCAWLSSITELDFRLPTEAEWEYACRGGTATRYFFGDGTSELGEHARHFDNSHSVHGVVATADPTTVGERRPNSFGLFDVYGNAAEWCSDWYDAGYYLVSPRANPAGPAAPGPDADGWDRTKVVRGGDCTSIAVELRSASRACWELPGRVGIGFRCAARFRSR